MTFRELPPGRGPRRRRDVGPRTIHVSENDLELGRRLFPEKHDRPKTRSECVDGHRPCPYVGCKYHLYLHVEKSGNIKLNFPDLEVDELEHSCALDVAAQGGATLEQLAQLMNVTRERVRQIEEKALTQLRRKVVQIVKEEDSSFEGSNEDIWEY